MKPVAYGVRAAVVVLCLLAAAIAGDARAANACLSSDGGIGGTGLVPDDGGMGGTGKTADEGGIGGTGIVGVITGFASLCVAGREVHYDGRTVVTRNGVPASLRDLAIGQVISVEARPAKEGLVAQRVSVVDAVVGPVTALHGDVIEVMGQRARLTPETIRADAGVAPRAGDTLRVSGQRLSDGTVVATRIERAPGEQSSLLGVVQRTAPGSFVLSGVRVDTPTAGTLVSSRKEVLAVGRWDGSRLVASRITVDPVENFGPRVERLVLEGFVSGTGKGGSVKVGERDVVVGPSTLAGDGEGGAVARDQRVRVSGRIDSQGKVRADRVQVRRELLPAAERGLRTTPEVGKDGEMGSSGRSGGDNGRKEERALRGNGSRADGEPDRSDSSGRDRTDDGRDDRIDSKESGHEGPGGEAARGSGADRRGGGGEDKGNRGGASGADRPARVERPERPPRVERIDRGRDH